MWLGCGIYDYVGTRIIRRKKPQILTGIDSSRGHHREQRLVFANSVAALYFVLGATITYMRHSFLRRVEYVSNHLIRLDGTFYIPAPFRLRMGRFVAKCGITAGVSVSVHLFSVLMLNARCIKNT